ncbi:hypothetical protein EYF80_044911 [Liparis tanakae]|uniref:Uncharacterized protein n=1 Tax=Liparis tanakae TaxID=230148 RepID=A0A4Z2FUL5_9TELE|nr:hypothetical protein EYF80_044911 [Liparis tanakae]
MAETDEQSSPLPNYREEVERRCRRSPNPLAAFPPGRDRPAVIRRVTRADSLIDRAAIRRRRTPGRAARADTGKGALEPAHADTRSGEEKDVQSQRGRTAAGGNPGGAASYFDFCTFAATMSLQGARERSTLVQSETCKRKSATKFSFFSNAK